MKTSILKICSVTITQLLFDSLVTRLQKRFLHMLGQKEFLSALLFGMLASSCSYKNAEVYEDPTRGYIDLIPSSIKVQKLSVKQYADMMRASSRHEQALRLLESCISLRMPDKESYRTMTPSHCTEEKRHLDDALELVNVLRKLKSLQDSNPQPLLKTVIYALRRGSIDGAEILPGRHSTLCVAPLVKNEATILMDNMPDVTSGYLRGTTIHASLCQALSYPVSP